MELHFKAESRVKQDLLYLHAFGETLVAEQEKVKL